MGYVVRYRKGKPIKVDRQIIRWRRARKKAEQVLEDQRIAESIANAADRKFFE